MPYKISLYIPAELAIGKIDKSQIKKQQDCDCKIDLDQKHNYCYKCGEFLIVKKVKQSVRGLKDFLFPQFQKSLDSFPANEEHYYIEELDDSVFISIQPNFVILSYYPYYKEDEEDALDFFNKIFRRAAACEIVIKEISRTPFD